MVKMAGHSSPPLQRRWSAEHCVKLRRDIGEERAPRHGAQSKVCGVTRCTHLSSLRQLQRFVGLPDENTHSISSASHPSFTSREHAFLKKERAVGRSRATPCPFMKAKPTTMHAFPSRPSQ